MTLHLPDARQRGPRDMALRVLHLGDPRGVGVRLQRDDRNFQCLRALFRPVTKLISGPATGMRVYRRHRIPCRRRHAFGDKKAELPGTTRRQEHRGRAYYGGGPQPTSRRHNTPLYPVQPRPSSHGFPATPAIRPYRRPLRFLEPPDSGGASAGTTSGAGATDGQCARHSSSVISPSGVISNSVWNAAPAACGGNRLLNIAYRVGEF